MDTCGHCPDLTSLAPVKTLPFTGPATHKHSIKHCSKNVRKLLSLSGIAMLQRGLCVELESYTAAHVIYPLVSWEARQEAVHSVSADLLALPPANNPAWEQRGSVPLDNITVSPISMATVVPGGKHFSRMRQDARSLTSWFLNPGNPRWAAFQQLGLTPPTFHRGTQSEGFQCPPSLMAGSLEKSS